MKILFLTNLLPYPLDNGGKIKTYTTLQVLKRAGYSVDLLCFKETLASMQPEEERILEFCSSVKQVFLRLTTASNKKYMAYVAANSLFSSLPYSVFKYRSKEMSALLKKYSISKEYDYIYFDHLPMCVYYSEVKKLWPNAKTILDEHNCETVISLRNAQNQRNFAKRMFLRHESKKLKKFEAYSILSVDRTAVLSNEDYSALKQMTVIDFPHIIIPIGVLDKGIRNPHTKKGNAIDILFVGTLTWEPNNRGLIWFLDKVVPKLKRDSVEFTMYIVGKNPSDEVKARAAQYDNIIITGYVLSVDDYYDKCDCTVIPLFIGSGQRVKIIEAFSKGMPAISTSIGAEGLEYRNNENILIADTADSFAHAIEKMADKKLANKISKEARNTYLSYYSQDAVSTRILELFAK